MADCKQSSYATTWNSCALPGATLWPAVNYARLQSRAAGGSALGKGGGVEGGKGKKNPGPVSKPGWGRLLVLPIPPLPLAPSPHRCDSCFPALCCLLPAQKGAGKRGGKKRHNSRRNPPNAPHINIRILIDKREQSRAANWLKKQHVDQPGGHTHTHKKSLLLEKTWGGEKELGDADVDTRCGWGWGLKKKWQPQIHVKTHPTMSEEVAWLRVENNKSAQTWRWSRGLNQSECAAGGLRCKS